MTRFENVFFQDSDATDSTELKIFIILLIEYSCLHWKNDFLVYCFTLHKVE